MADLGGLVRQPVGDRDDERVATGAEAQVLSGCVEEHPVAGLRHADELRIGERRPSYAVDPHDQFDHTGAYGADADDITPAPVDHPATIPTILLASRRDAAQGRTPAQSRHLPAQHTTPDHCIADP